MPIDVTCAGCKTRFQVSEKFAGKKGPCPKCKTIIQIPTLKEQVKIDEPEPVGGKTKTGQPIFRPILRTETRLSREAAIAIGATVAVIVIGALILRLMPGQVSPIITSVGAILLAPALAMAGYAFLRDDELEPYRGPQLWLRLAACAAVYPALWGLYWLVFAYLGVDPTQNLYFLVAVIPIVIAFGMVAAMSAFDFDFGPAILHYCVYLVATIGLRMLMGMNVLWDAVPKT
jgi:hypothetical protein